MGSSIQNNNLPVGSATRDAHPAPDAESDSRFKLIRISLWLIICGLAVFVLLNALVFHLYLIAAVDAAFLLLAIAALL